MANQPVLLIVTNNHFDQTWRRCWERPFSDQGRKFVSYADLEEFYMLDNLELARANPGYKFEAESAYVLRKFLERHADRKGELVELARQGRFAVTGAGELIVDGNMITGESLVRNFVDGLLWVERTIGQKTRLAVRNDAFGNPAQLPQILRGVEIHWATGFSYSPAEGRYWRGLDGSTILAQTLPVAAAGGGNTKYPPCIECQGEGAVEGKECPVCRGRGIDPRLKAWLPGEIDDAAMREAGAGLVVMGPEELLPNPEILAWARSQEGRYDVRFATEEEAAEFVRPWLDAVDNPPEDRLHPGVELNPNNSGVLVTRIATKQNVRRQEYRLMATEALGVMAALAKHHQAWAQNMADALKLVRHQQFFTMFHDAITATHIDAAYDELLDYYRIIDAELDAAQAEIMERLVTPEAGTLSVINPFGGEATRLVSAAVAENQVPVDESGRKAKVIAVRKAPEGGVVMDFLAESVPAFGAKIYRLEPGAAPAVETGRETSIQNSRFTVEGDEHGLTRITDRRLGRVISEQAVYRPGELILEHDEGSPWATLSDDQRRRPLSLVTQFAGSEKSEHVQRLIYTVETPREGGFSGRALVGTLAVSLIEGEERVNFHFECWWDGFNHRLRAAFPLAFTGRHIYEVPYGMLEREPYVPTFGWAGANGDWPATCWAGVEGAGISAVLFNRGTPSYRIEPEPDGSGEVILLSLLRSPALPTYLHEPEFYTMTAYDGMRDMGEHAFDFALGAYGRPLAQSEVVADGESYNRPLCAVPGRALSVGALLVLPRIQAGNARIAAVKWAEDGQGYALRVVEFRGQGGETVIRLPGEGLKVEKTNLLERGGESLPVTEGAVRLSLRPFEIATLKITVTHD